VNPVQDFSATAAGIAHGLSHALGLSVQVQEGASPHTDCSGTLVVPPPASDKPADVVAWHGLLDHESAHVLYTSDPGNTLKTEAGDAADALNLLEDCRVNHKLAASYLGTKSNLKAAYAHTRARIPADGLPGHYMRAIAAAAAISPDTQGCFRDLAPASESAERAGWDIAEAWGLRNREAILGAPSARALIPLARELQAIIAAEPGKPEDGKPEDGKPEDGKPEDGKPEDGKPEDGKPEDGKPEDGKPEDGKPEDGKPEDGKPEDGKPEDGKPEDGKPEDGKPGDPGAGLDAGDPKPSTAPPKPFNPLDLSSVAEKPEGSKKTAPRVVQGRADLGPVSADREGVSIRRDEAPLARYVFAQGAGIAADLRTAVQTRTSRRRIGEQEEGPSLDESTLADLAARVPGVKPWQSVTRGMYADTAVCIVLDGSGSMSNAPRDGTGHWPDGVPGGSRWDAACGAGAALALALASLPRTRAMVWATPNFTTERRGLISEDRSTAVLLSNWGGRPTVKDCETWTHVYPRAETECWASNIRLAIPILRAQRCARRIVVLITDGGLTHSDQTTKELPNADREAQAAGVEVYGVAWGSSANWQNKLPKSRTLQDNTLLPTRAWLRAVARLLLNNSTVKG
jgi:hypothetical protein